VPTNLLKTVKTPCIGVCSTGIGDAVCRGCKRYAHEVIHWNSYNQQQKQLIDGRLTDFLSQIVASKLTVVDANKLRWHLDTQNIPYVAHKGPYTWAYELLRAGASQIDCVDDYGLQLDAQYCGQSLVALRLAIDNEFFILSQAHYERYFDVASTQQVTV
tara:strand:+ start:44328 stop:44804 length:477 start_codon:yes stop_codon:yes gene_type:complete